MADLNLEAQQTLNTAQQINRTQSKTNNDIEKALRDYLRIQQTENRIADDFSKLSRERMNQITKETSFFDRSISTAKQSFDALSRGISELNSANKSAHETMVSLMNKENQSKEDIVRIADLYQQIKYNNIMIAKSKEEALNKDRLAKTLEECKLRYLRNQTSAQDKLNIAKENMIKRQKQLHQLEMSGLKEKNAAEYDAEKKKINNDYNKSMSDLGSVFGSLGSRLSSSTIGGKDVASLVGNVLGPVPSTLSTISKIVSGISSKLSSFNDSMVGGVIGIYNSMGKVESRLYGSDKSFYGLLENMNKTIGMSSLVSQQEVLQQMTNLVAQGINYNLEQRSLLSTLSDDLVSTFDVMNENLTRLVRLQQQDTTQAYMGAESLLTAFLNSNYNDTSYLSTMYDSVYSAIIDGIAGLDTDQATQFNYNLQKWLGSLYSVGLSSSAVSGIASAINDIATGNLNSNSQTLLALSAQRSGNSYASYLTQGLQGDDVNVLMKSMIEYLSSIASNTDSNVIKKQFGNMFGLTMSDWTAIQNLSTSDIGNIFNNTVNIATATQETEKLLNETLSTRIHTSTKIDNILENAKWAYGTSIANNENAYATYRADKFVNSIASMLDNSGNLLTTILSTVAKTFSAVGESYVAITGLKGLGSAFGASWDGNVSNILSGLLGTQDGRGGLGGMLLGVLDGFSNINSFGMSTSMRGGIGEAITENGATTYNSTSYSIATSNQAVPDIEPVNTIGTTQSDRQATSMDQASKTKAATYSNITSGESTVTKDINDLYSALFENTNNPLRIAVAFYEDRAISQLSNILGSADYFGSLDDMRNG